MTRLFMTGTAAAYQSDSRKCKRELCQRVCSPPLKPGCMQDRTVPFWTKLYPDREYASTNRTYQHAFYIPSKYQVRS